MYFNSKEVIVTTITRWLMKQTPKNALDNSTTINTITSADINFKCCLSDHKELIFTILKNFNQAGIMAGIYMSTPLRVYLK